MLVMWFTDAVFSVEYVSYHYSNYETPLLLLQGVVLQGIICTMYHFNMVSFVQCIISTWYHLYNVSLFHLYSAQFVSVCHLCKAFVQYIILSCIRPLYIVLFVHVQCIICTWHNLYNISFVHRFICVAFEYFVSCACHLCSVSFVQCNYNVSCAVCHVYNITVQCIMYNMASVQCFTCTRYHRCNISYVHDVICTTYYMYKMSCVQRIICKKSKGNFLYSAVSSPQDRSKRFTLYFPDRPVHSDTISAALGSIQPYATINARRLLVYISTTLYSQVLIYTAE